MAVEQNSEKVCLALYLEYPSPGEMGMWGCTHKDNNYLLMAAEYDGCLCNVSTLLWQKLGSISMFERELEMLFFLNSPLLLFLIWSTLWFSRVCLRAFCQSFNFHGAQLRREWYLCTSPAAPRSASPNLISTNAFLSYQMAFQVSQLQGDANLLPQNPGNCRKPENVQFSYSGRFEGTQGTLLSEANWLLM